VSDTTTAPAAQSGGGGKSRMRVEVCASEELPAGEMIGTQLGPMPVVVVRAPDGTLHAVLDKCLHQGGRLSKGRLGAASFESTDVGDYRYDRAGEILRCPWHGFEYDIRDGSLLAEPSRCLRTFTVTEEDGKVFVSL
jgi:nitrite reductase/ring-hydroxylating ferredoxin subunit